MTNNPDWQAAYKFWLKTIFNEVFGLHGGQYLIRFHGFLTRGCETDGSLTDATLDDSLQAVKSTTDDKEDVFGIDG